MQDDHQHGGGEDRFAFASQPDTGPAPILLPVSDDDATRLSMNREELELALQQARQVSYRWDITKDSMSWSGNIDVVLGLAPGSVANSRSFAALLDSENVFSRYDTVLRSGQMDDGDGVPYEIEYKMYPAGHKAGRGVWVEDHGRWFADANGVPCVATGVMRLADDRHARDQQMSFLSHCDPLTGMMNRSRMEEALGEAISVSIQDKLPCAFVIIAVNNLDIMNEAYGFEVADEVIVALGQRLRQVMRTGDGIARYSGSKFGIILNSCRPEELNAALERFMRAVRDSVIETRLGPVWALLSIGAVSLPALGDDAKSAIAHAEEALSEAFRLPGDGYIVYTSSEQNQARRLLNARCATEIVSCLREGLFKLAFQPVFDSRSRKVVMHEALLRMADTTGALITAGHLVPIAERLGLIRLIDRAVLQLALQTLETHPEAHLSVNISATTVTDPRWNAQLLDMIAAQPGPAGRLLVEITETAALGNMETSREFVQSLRSLNCGVALDDFGAGFTSYRNLKELPLSHIKLDGSFCCNLADGGENRTFVASMVDLAHAFGLSVIAEWVETEEDAAILAQLGVDSLQGNGLGEASTALPWVRPEQATQRREAPNLEPVAAHHFGQRQDTIETPRDMLQVDDAAPAPVPVSVTGPASAPIMPVAAREEPTLASIAANKADIASLDDATLEAEIALLAADTAEAPDTPDTVVAYSRTLEPLYETALAQVELRTDTDAGDVLEVVTVEAELALVLEEAEATIVTDSLVADSIDDNLALLRKALSDLSTALGGVTTSDGTASTYQQSA